MSSATIWFTGLHSAGKTTLAEQPLSSCALPGTRLSCSMATRCATSCARGSGSPAKIATHTSPASAPARAACQPPDDGAGSVIPQYVASRHKVRALHGERGADFVEVHAVTPLEVCSVRVVKGLYTNQRAGELVGLTGVDDAYGAPTAAQTTVATQDRTLDESNGQVLLVAASKGLA
jgi:adenylylsulfate kinase